MKNEEIIIFGYYVSEQNKTFEVDLDVFSDDIRKIIEVETGGLIMKLPQSKINEISEFKTRAGIAYQNFLKSNNNNQAAVKQVMENLIKDTPYYNQVFTDLFDERLAVAVKEYYVSTGVEEFDRYLTGGLQKQTLTGIQASTGRGKTTMLLTIGTNMLKLGYNVAFVNLEMNKTEFNNNILSGLSDKYSYADIKANNNSGNPSFIQSLKDEITSKKIGRHAMIINKEYDSINTLELENMILKTEKEQNIKFDAVLIDYLFLLKACIGGYKNEQGYEKLQRITQEGHKMAQRNNWAVLSVFQENRMGFKNTQAAGAGEMAGSFNALHDMDNYFKFYQDTDRDLIIIKPEKLRQYGSFNPDKDSFAMKYSPIKKVYIKCSESARKVSDYKWTEIYDIPFVHDNLCPGDFKLLCESIGITAPSDKNISIRKKKMNFNNTPHGKSLIDWKDINIDNVIRNYQNTPKTYSNTQNLLNDSPENLFNI